MRVILVFKERSEAAREAFEWMEEFKRRTGREVEQLDPETREGEEFCQARGIMEYPTLVVAVDDGNVVEQWSGRPMPIIDDIMAYVV